MVKRHDENQDLKAVGRVALVDTKMKVITIVNKDIIGIHTWGRIDFLTKYCGYNMVYVKNAQLKDGDSTKNKEYKEKARNKNAHSLSNKNARRKEKA